MKRRNLFLVLLISSLILTACGGDKKEEVDKTIDESEVEEVSLAEDELEETSETDSEKKKEEDSQGLFTEEEVYELAKKRLDLTHIEPSESLDSMRYMGEYLYAVNIGYSRKDGEYSEDVYIGADSLDVYDRGMLLISNLTKKELNE